MTLTPNQKGAAVIGVTLLVIGLSYLGYQIYLGTFKKMNSENFLDLQDNLGLKPNIDDIISLKFNDGKNIAQFYSNNRFFIFDNDKSVVDKGTYSNGGKMMVLDSGKTIQGGSVFGNLLNI